MPLSLRLASLLAAGSAAGLHLHGSWRLLAWLALAAALGAWLAHTRRVHGAVVALLATATCAAAAGRSAQAVAAAEHPPLVQWFDAQVRRGAEDKAPARELATRVRGWLLRDAAPTERGAQLQVAVTHIRMDGAWRATSGGLAVSVSGDLLDDLSAWRAGRLIEAPVTIRRPAQYRNAGLADQARALARRGTPLVGTTKSGVLVQVEAAGAWWDEGAADLRARVRRAMADHVAPHAAVSAAVGTAILIGDRARLAPEVEQRLQEAGTYHVVAISGGNIALLAGAVLALLWIVRVRFAFAAAIATIVLIAHAWIVGGGPSVVRATAMAAIYLALRLIDQRTSPVHAVAVAVAGILALSPLEIAGAGFWLTFGATAALLMAAARWPRPAPGRWWAPVAAITMASVAVELLLMPISAFVFERVTLAGLVLNLAAVPAMGLVQATASVCVLADVLGLEAVARTSGRAAHLAAQALLGSSGLVADVPWATWRVPAPPVALLGAYYLNAAGWWWVSAPPADTRVRRRARALLASTAAVLWAWIATAPLSLWPSPGATLRIMAVDVGQGDAFLVRAPDGHSVMVDAGGLAGRSFDIGDRVVGPALRAQGVRRLDYLAVTHADLDHLGGARTLLRDFSPREVWAGVPVTGHRPLDALQADARARRTPWRWLQRGDRLHVGGVEVRVHHPPLPDWDRQRVRNDDSLVLEVRYGAVSVWLTGDITRAVEDEVAASFAEHGRVVVLKAAHHGSLTSSGRVWLDRMRPAVVLISAGRGNLFGHPAPAVLRRYADVGAEIFRTDVDGQIELVTNGHFVEVATFMGRRWRLR